MEKYELTDYQWSLIKPLIPHKTSICGRARRDPRQLFNAIFWVLITGYPWCALPKHYFPQMYTSLHPPSSDILEFGLVI